METVIGLMLIIGLPAILIYTLVMLEAFAVTRWWLIGAALAWGALSFLIADAIQRYERSDLGVDPLLIILASAPLLEEALKLAFLLVIYNRMWARYSGDGLVYGFAIGSGFAIIENAAYLLGQSDLVLAGALSRIVTTGLFHACLMGIVGAGVCGVIYYRRRSAYPFFFILFLFAIIAHYGFNVYAVAEIFVTDITISVGFGVLAGAVVIGLQLFIRSRTRQRILGETGAALDPLQRVIIGHGAAIMADLDRQSRGWDTGQAGIMRAYVLNEAQAALLTHLEIRARGKRQNIQPLRDALNTLHEQQHPLRQQLSAQTWTWLETYPHRTPQS